MSFVDELRALKTVGKESVMQDCVKSIYQSQLHIIKSNCMSAACWGLNYANLELIFDNPYPSGDYRRVVAERFMLPTSYLRDYEAYKNMLEALFQKNLSAEGLIVDTCKAHKNSIRVNLKW